MTIADQYRYTVHWSEDDQEWVGRCDAFPSLSWLAPERQEALAGIRESVTDGVGILEGLGRKVPEATPGDSGVLVKQPCGSGRAAVHAAASATGSVPERVPRPRGRRWLRRLALRMKTG